MLSTFTPGSGTAQFIDTLSPSIELYSPADVLLAAGQGNPNQSLDAAIATAGTYRIRVLSVNATSGEYFFGASVRSTLPEVTAVYMSGGSNWSPDFYSYLAASGLGDAQLGYRLLGGAGQLLPLPWTNITTLSVVFNQDVTIDTANAGLALVGSPDLPQPAALASAAFSYVAADTAQWTFAAPLALDKYLLELPSAAVTNSQGVPLDGEWTTGTSSFPSGDGIDGGGFAFRFDLLPGDVDQNGVVTGVNGNAVRLQLLQDTSAPGYSALLDVNGDGTITGQDGAAVRMELLQALPSNDPQPPGNGFAIAAALLEDDNSAGPSDSTAIAAADRAAASPNLLPPNDVTIVSAMPIGVAAIPTAPRASGHRPTARHPVSAIHDLVIECLAADEIPALKSNGVKGVASAGTQDSSPPIVVRSTRVSTAPISTATASTSLAGAGHVNRPSVAMLLHLGKSAKPVRSTVPAAAKIENSGLARIHDLLLEEFERTAVKRKPDA